MDHEQQSHLRHLLFFTGVFVLIAVVLLSSSTVSNAPASGNTVPQNERPVALPPATGTVCCTFMANGVQRTCAAAEGQTCAVCAAVCAPQ